MKSLGMMNSQCTMKSLYMMNSRCEEPVYSNEPVMYNEEPAYYVEVSSEVVMKSMCDKELPNVWKRAGVEQGNSVW